MSCVPLLLPLRSVLGSGFLGGGGGGVDGAALGLQAVVQLTAGPPRAGSALREVGTHQSVFLLALETQIIMFQLEQGTK